MGIIAWIVFGFIVGLIARALLPGRQSMGFMMTTLLGIAGSLIGGLVASAVWGQPGSAGQFQPAGFIGSLVGAIALLVIGAAVMGPRRRLV
jgi:uncharacterized membrane protein YeaQ/YmgE (transglycosylase-associated protein family)